MQEIIHISWVILIFLVILKWCHSQTAHLSSVQVCRRLHRRSQIEPSDSKAKNNEFVGAPFRRVQLLHSNERLEKLDLTSSSSTPGAKMKAEEEGGERHDPGSVVRTKLKVRYFPCPFSQAVKARWPSLSGSRHHSGTVESSGSARRGTAAEEEMAAPELDLQCVVSSAKEGETAGVQVQAYEGLSKSAAADTLHPPSRPDKVCWKCG